ncbi:M48 family metalloprotease [Variovorax sp. LARHSF232]
MRVPDGEYILYDPDWFREVIGDDRDQAIALFGHELGHFYNRHFERKMSEEEKETEADVSAGCAVARLSGDFSRLQNLLSRIRTESGGGGYPSRETSVKAAKQGFDDCLGRQPKETPAPGQKNRIATDIFKEPSGRRIQDNTNAPVRGQELR